MSLLLTTTAAPLGVGAGFALFGVVVKARGDGFGVGGCFELKDEPIAFGGSGECEGIALHDHLELGRVVALAGGGGEGLCLDFHRLHVLVEKGDVEFTVLIEDFAVQ